MPLILYLEKISGEFRGGDKWTRNAPPIKMESFTNQQERLFSGEKRLTSAGYILI